MYILEKGSLERYVPFGIVLTILAIFSIMRKSLGVKVNY